MLLFEEFISFTLELEKGADETAETAVHLNSLYLSIFTLPWFIVFLNDNFTGGELIFDNNEFTPKVGDMVYFSGEEYHRVNNCVGKRYTLIGFMMNNPLDVESQRNFL